jgi:hypothetical protein
MKKVLNLLALTFIIGGLISAAIFIIVWPNQYGIWVTWFSGTLIVLSIGGLILIININSKTRK